MKTQDQEERNFRRALEVIRTRFWVIVACTVLAGGVAFAISSRQPDQYRTSASLLIRDQNFDETVFGRGVGEFQDPARELATNLRLVSTREVADATSRALRRDGRDISSDDVRGMIGVEGADDSDILDITATDTDPDRATIVALVFAQQYIEFRKRADQRAIDEARAVVRRQLENLPPGERASSPANRRLQQRADQLEVISALQTGNAELVERPERPSGAFAPDVRGTTILGALIGLVLGFVAAFLLERFDRRLKSAGEVEEASGLALLGVIPHANRRARVDLAPEATEAFRMLHANLRYFNLDRQIRSVLVTSASSGDGKTTVSWSLAKVAALSGRRVLLVEADLRHPTLRPPGNDEGLVGVLVGGVSLHHAVSTVEVTGEPTVEEILPDSAAPTLDVLRAGATPPNPAALLETQTMRELLDLAEAQYDLVVIDTPPLLLVPDAIPLITRASAVVTVARINKTTRDQVLALNDQLTKLGADLVGMVVNDVRSRDDAYGYGYGYTTPRERSLTVGV